MIVVVDVDGGGIAIDAAASPPTDARESLASHRRDASPRTALLLPDAATTLPIDAAPAPTPAIDAAAASEPARIAFVFDTWCDLVVDGEARGRADRTRELRLAPGRHVVTCGQGAGLGGWSQTVDVVAGEVRRIEGTLLRPVEVVIAAGDQVRIGTHTAARGDTITIRPGRYRVEITTKGQKAAAVYVDIPRVPRCTLRNSPRVDCYR